MVQRLIRWPIVVIAILSPTEITHLRPYLRFGAAAQMRALLYQTRARSNNVCFAADKARNPHKHDRADGGHDNFGNPSIGA